MTEEPVPVAVVGTGNMGANHVRVFDELPGAELVEVVEPDESRAAEIGDSFDVTVRERAEELELAEAASVAAPNEFHRPISETLLDRGVDLMVEKPLAPTVEDARAIVEAADAADAVLQVGHIERFNPAVETLSEVLEHANVIAIEAHRLGPFKEQLSEESVVFDLMIHDLDVVDYLVDAAVDHVDAVGRQSRSKEIDHAVATVQYDNEVLATTVSSHVTPGKIRRLDVTTEEAYITLDYQQQDLLIQRKGVEEVTALSGNAAFRAETVTEQPYVRTREPLKNELEHFLECVQRREPPRVDGRTGLAAVERAATVVRHIQSHDDECRDGAGQDV